MPIQYKDVLMNIVGGTKVTVCKDREQLFVFDSPDFCTLGDMEQTLNASGTNIICVEGIHQRSTRLHIYAAEVLLVVIYIQLCLIFFSLMFRLCSGRYETSMSISKTYMNLS